MLRELALFLFLAVTACCAAQPPRDAVSAVTGQWVTIDDETGKKRSIMEITEKNGRLHGRVIKLFREPDEDPDPVCTECGDHRKGQKVVGMEVFNDLVLDDDVWEGEILDPKNGKIYDCKIWPEDGKLKVRGYLLFLYRTQTWVREKDLTR
ncbi:MAG: DUF2147 domain-containing protein [Flavobacteriales bacterium]|nr:DUF2147 domain-containing protein [Flavobacteriales bacterium]